MKIRLLFFITFTVGILISCKKTVTIYTIKGTLTDQTFNQPLTNSTIDLYKITPGSTYQKHMGTFNVGSDGGYLFSFPREKAEKYILKITKANYFYLESEIYLSELSIDSDNVYNFSTTAKSWVKLTFKNTLNPSAGDKLKYIKQLGKEGCTECCSDTEQFLDGIIDTSIYCINDGNQYYSYLYFKMGTTFSGIMETQTVAFDTTEIILNY